MKLSCLLDYKGANAQTDFSLVDNARAPTEVFFGGGLGYGYMVAIHITDPPNYTLSWAYGHARGFKQNTRQLALAPACPQSHL